MSWFSKKSSKSAKPAPNASATILRLRDSISTQEKREDHLESKIKGMIKEAKGKMSAGDKKGALFVMKRKKLYEQELEKIQNVKMTLETQVMNLESASQNANTFVAMHEGKNAMQKIRKNVGIDKVDDMMDDIRDEMDMTSEISNAIGQSVDNGMFSEDELLSELAELEAQPTSSSKVNLPAVPNSKLPALNKSEANELKKLEAELAMIS